VFKLLKFCLWLALCSISLHWNGQLITTLQWRRQRGTQIYMKLFVTHKMTRNTTLNKVHVAATEVPQLLSQNTNVFG